MKMPVENAALYRQGLANVKLPWLSLIGLALCVICAGCPANSKQTEKPSNESPSPSVSTVPLRVWFVADPSDKPVIERQWQATYDQPVDVTIFTPEELLKQTKPACDTLVYPAWMLGDLVTRNWVAELPSKLQEKNAQASDEEVGPLPPGWLDQARFDRKSWGLTLSVLPTVVMANFEIPKAREVGPTETVTSEEAIAYWQSLAVALKAKRTASAGAQASEKSQDDPQSTLDAQAVCDRYMTILMSISNHENIIGALFHPDSLTPRVSDANFATAAKLMQELHAAGGNSRALLSSHSSAWSELNSSKPSVTITIPPAPSGDIDKVNAIIVAQPPANPAKSGMRVSAGWNSGRGLIVSISKQCRQTSVSIDFARWLASDTSRQVFSKRIAGFNAESAYAPGSSAWQAQRIVQRLGQQPRLASEPRLPQSLAYRKALGEQIGQILIGQKSVDAALAEVDKAWREITASCDSQIQIPAYVQSLGL